MTKTVSLFMVISTASMSAFAADEYSTPALRAEWIQKLRLESELPVTGVFHESGFLVGLRGKFKLPRGADPVSDWLMTHAMEFGLPATPGLSVIGSRLVWDAEPVGEIDSVELIRGTLVELRLGSLVGTSDSDFSVLVDPSSRNVLGVYSSWHPPLKGMSDVSPVSDAEAWKIAETYVGSPLSARSSRLIWSSANWLLNGFVDKKEALWVLSARDSQNLVRDLVVSSSSKAVVVSGDPVTALATRPQQHLGYSTTGTVFWSSFSQQTVCFSPSVLCTEPAFSDSLVSRNEIPLISEMWLNISSQGPSYAWPYRSSRANPLALVSPNTAIPFRVVLAGTQCVGIGQAKPAPCGDYDTKTLLSRELLSDVFGHELGHSFYQDLGKSGTHNPALLDGALEEALCDWTGIVTEDHRLMVDNRNPQAPRTDWKIVSRTSQQDLGLLARCSPQSVTPPSLTRGYVQAVIYEAWTLVHPNQIAHRNRDVLFTQLRNSSFAVDEATTKNFPKPLDFVSAAVALSTGPLGARLSPTQALAQAAINTGCWRIIVAP